MPPKRMCSSDTVDAEIESWCLKLSDTSNAAFCENWPTYTTSWKQSHEDVLICMDRIYMDVSKNRGTPKSSILIGFSIINHPFWGPTPIFGNTHVVSYLCFQPSWLECWNSSPRRSGELPSHPRRVGLDHGPRSKSGPFIQMMGENAAAPEGRAAVVLLHMIPTNCNDTL